MVLRCPGSRVNGAGARAAAPARPSSSSASSPPCWRSACSAPSATSSGSRRRRPSSTSSSRSTRARRRSSTPPTARGSGFIQYDILRTPIPGTDIPQTVKDATVAIEDERFYEHKGVDAEGVVRAAIKNIESGKTVEGGSTLTMQLVRTLYITKERTFKRKIHEAKLAEELENIHDKTWILNKYLNNAPYGTVGGQTAIGVQAAARVFFDKPAARLELHEAALLAGLPQAPSHYNPFYEESKALRRRNQVLDKMAELRMIEPSRRAAEAKERPLGVQPSRYYTARRESYFFDYVKQRLINKYGIDEVRRGGMSIYTTIDLKMQRKAREAISSVLSFPNAPKSAIVTVDPRNGKHPRDGVVGVLRADEVQPRRAGPPPAGLDVQDHGPHGRAVARRLARGHVVHVQAAEVQRPEVRADRDEDVRQHVRRADEPRPRDDEVRQLGLHAARARPRPRRGQGGRAQDGHQVQAQRLPGRDPRRPRARRLAARDGQRLRDDRVGRHAQRAGRDHEGALPRRHGRRPSSASPGARASSTEGVTAKATDILEQNVKSGTGTKAQQIGCPAAGKTGTTDNHTDAWFVGYTPNLATAVWVGFPTRRVEMYPPVTPISVAGGTYPAEIWGRYMKGVKRGCGDFKKPATPFKAAPFFGKYATTGAPAGGGYGYDPNDPNGGAYVPDPRPGAAADETGGGTDGGDGRQRRRRQRPGGTGGGGYDPDLYETPPQAAPETQAPPADAPGADPPRRAE